MEPGITYSKEHYRNSNVHILEIDLTIRSIRAIPAGPEFPLSTYFYHDGTRPPQLAEAAGAFASIGGGFEMTKYHDTGVWGQPLQALVVDKEIWTTGVGAGGYAYLQGENRAWVQPNRIFVTIWIDGHNSFPVDSVNRGHEGTVAFNPRGGTNEKPRWGRHYVRLGQPGEWKDGEEASVQSWIVKEVSDNYGLKVYPNTVVLESEESLGLVVDQKIAWSQHLGGSGTTQVIAGMTELVREGSNTVGYFYAGEDPGGPDAPYRKPNPRTAIGVSGDGLTAFFVVIEGRIENSTGLRLKALAHLMIKLGAHSAMNMDGGGSSHMWIRGMSKPGLEPGLVCDSCYGDGTLNGIRPNIYSTAVF